MNRASRLRREAKQAGRGRGVKSFPPTVVKKEWRGVEVSVSDAEESGEDGER
jgi:hypothetical protein